MITKRTRKNTSRRRKEKVTVLITSAGVASAVNVIKSLRLQHEIPITLIAVDTDRLAAGLHLVNYWYLSPPVLNADEYVQFLANICKKHKVQALFPCYSKELSLIANNKEVFQKMGVALLLPPSSVIDMCNDKIRIVQKVRDIGIPTPAMIAKPTAADLPLFSKLLEGSGSRGALYIDNKYMLDGIVAAKERRLFQEFIQGVEYTVDVLCDERSQVLFCGPRKRIQTKDGQSVKAITVHSEVLAEYTQRICSTIGMVGICNIQFIEKEGTFYFVEINPRYAAGGLMLTVRAGANLPLAALKLMLGLPLGKGQLKHPANIEMTRYWEEIILESNA